MQSMAFIQRKLSFVQEGFLGTIIHTDCEENLLKSILQSNISPHKPESNDI